MPKLGAFVVYTLMVAILFLRPQASSDGRRR